MLTPEAAEAARFKTPEDPEEPEAAEPEEVVLPHPRRMESLEQRTLVVAAAAVPQETMGRQEVLAWCW